MIDAVCVGLVHRTRETGFFWQDITCTFDDDDLSLSVSAVCERVRAGGGRGATASRRALGHALCSEYYLEFLSLFLFVFFFDKFEKYLLFQSIQRRHFWLVKSRALSDLGCLWVSRNRARERTSS